MRSNGMSNFRTYGERILRHCRQHGIVSTARFLGSRLVRYRSYVVYEADLETPRAYTAWGDGEVLKRIGREELDAALTESIRAFLGGEDAFESIQGVREGNLLFLVTIHGEVQHCGYILFCTRQTKILGEDAAPPLIANCFTASIARGRGLYRKALNDELCYLRERGYRRAIIETDPENLPSRKGIEAAGFRLVRKIGNFILLNWLVLQRSHESSRSRWRLLAL